jgi:hypothetical protein
VPPAFDRLFVRQSLPPGEDCRALPVWLRVDFLSSVIPSSLWKGSYAESDEDHQQGHFFPQSPSIGICYSSRERQDRCILVQSEICEVLF